MIAIENYIQAFAVSFNAHTKILPWNFVSSIANIISDLIPVLGSDFIVDGNLAIHKTATIESGAVLKGPLIISKNCFVAAHAYLRGGVYLAQNVTLGPGCEVKSSAIFNNSALAHFNFMGDSIIGSNVNFEAGSIIANHYNERTDKSITVLIDGVSYKIPSTKFGALVGDNCKIGANAVLSPGSILKPSTIVNRLELVDQSKT